MAILYKWVGFDADLAVAIGLVSHTSDELVVYVHLDEAALCYHGNQVRLVQPPVDSSTGTSLHFFRGSTMWVIIHHIEFVRPTLTDIKIVVLVVCISIHDAKEDRTRTLVALDNLHLDLKDEVAEVSGRGDTVIPILWIWCNGMVGFSFEGTIGIYVPTMTLAIVAQRVREGQRATMSVGVRGRIRHWSQQREHISTDQQEHQQRGSCNDSDAPTSDVIM